MSHAAERPNGAPVEKSLEPSGALGAGGPQGLSLSRFSGFAEVEVEGPRDGKDRGLGQGPGGGWAQGRDLGSLGCGSICSCLVRPPQLLLVTAVGSVLLLTPRSGSDQSFFPELRKRLASSTSCGTP